MYSYMSNMASNGGKFTGKRKASDTDETEDDTIVHINFSIRGQDGNDLHFRANQDRPLKVVFRKYCQNLNLEYGTINFMYEGKHIRDNATPRMLKMKDGDQIDAAKHQTGGGGGAGGN